MLKIRLMRIGAKKRPFYRVVVIDERSKRNGAYIENVGTYDPMTTPHSVILKQDRIDHWLKQGAQKSDGFLRIIGEAPQIPPRKAKKVAKEEPEKTTSEVVQPATSEVESQVEGQTEKSQEQIATEPEAPHNDEEGSEEK